MVRVFDHDPAAQAVLEQLLHEPSLYDEFLGYLHRQGLRGAGRAARPRLDASRTRSTPSWCRRFTHIYEHSHEHWRLYETCEELVDLEDNFQLWRFRHLKTVERTIGSKRGTGGSSGVPFLRRALELTFFPELYAVRAEIGVTVP